MTVRSNVCVHAGMYRRACFHHEVLRRRHTEDQPYGKKPTKREIRLLREGLCPPPPPPEPPSTPPRRVSVLALRPQDMDKLKEKQALSAEIDRAFSGSKYA